MARKELPAEGSSNDSTSTSKSATAKANSTINTTTSSTASTKTKRKLADSQQPGPKDSAEQRSSTDADSPASKFKKLEISQIEGPHPTPLKTSSPPPPPQLPTTTTSPTSPVVSQAPVSPPAATNTATATDTAATTASQPAVEALTDSGDAKKNKNRKNKKRKQPAVPNADRMASKKSKTDGDGGTDDPDNEDHDDNDDDDDSAPHDPTTAELRQADRPENVPQIETTRQKKRDKHAKVQETAKVDSVQREELRNREYLVQWRDDRTAWKYNKLRQISITKSLFRDAPELDDELWQLAMEYLCGTQGQLRQVLREAAQRVIDTIDARIAAESNNALVQTVNYTRARTFLQMLE